MTRTLTTLTIVLLLILSAGLTAKPSSAADRLGQVAEQYVKKWFEFDPVYATQMGNHSYDDRYPDFSQRSFGKFASALRDLRKSMNGISQGELSVEQKVDYLTLQGSIETQLLCLGRSPLMQDNPKLFSDKATDGIYQIMLSQSLSDTVKLESILGRLDDLPRFLASAQKLMKEPPQIWILLADDEVENMIGFLNDIVGYFGPEFPQRRDELQEKITKAASALEDFSDFLDTLKTKEGQPFAVGKDFYDKLLKQQYFLDYDSDSLLKIGEALFAKSAKLYDSVSAIVDTLPMPEDFAYFIPKSFCRNDVMDYFQWEINQTRDWIVSHDFASVPASVGECIPVETSVFIRNVVGGIAYQPVGPFEKTQIGRFYVQPSPDSLSDANRSAYFRYCTRRGFKGAVAYDVYPGHHLQMQMANHNPSLIRRIQRDNMMVEGWALYCEEEMYKEKFYGDDLRTYLATLSGIRFDAARIVVDVKLQTGQFTYQQAVDWMVANLDAEVDYIEKEVNRFTLAPTQPSSNLLGKEYLLMIRDLYKTKLGQKYTLRKFHDFILGQGGISPVLVYKQLTGQIF
jgi:uncharacterized protein (DUF885 family)